MRTNSQVRVAVEQARLDAKPGVPGPIPREALDYFVANEVEPSLGLRQAWAAEHRAAHSAAQLMEQDVLADIRDELSRALRDGGTFREFKNSLRDRLAARGWWGERQVTDPVTGETRTIALGPRRLKTIFDTNLRMARAAGHWERIQATKETRPYLLYVLGPSERHRPEHVALAGTLLPADDPFWDVAFPPNGFGCRCSVRQLSVREAGLRGGVTERPIPRVDEGFRANAGRRRTPASSPNRGL